MRVRSGGSRRTRRKSGAMRSRASASKRATSASSVAGAIAASSWMNQGIALGHLGDGDVASPLAGGEVGGRQGQADGFAQRPTGQRLAPGGKGEREILHLLGIAVLPILIRRRPHPALFGRDLLDHVNVA